MQSKGVLSLSRGLGAGSHILMLCAFGGSVFGVWQLGPVGADNWEPTD